MKILISHFFLLSCLIYVSCSSGGNSKNATKNNGSDSIQTPANVPVIHHFRVFNSGEAINHIPCLQDAAASFCLYLPKDYDSAKTWPVIYLFDAHARGKLAVNKYKELAETYQVILVGSNNSQNGLQPEAYDKIANDLFFTTQTILNIAHDKIITAGFSGGGKVAASVAIKNSAVSSVISCGAGLDTKNLGSGYFNYVTVVGKGDFNYWDMVGIDQQISKTPLKHLLLTFDGIHEWPDTKTMSEAISFAMDPTKNNSQIANSIDYSLEQKETGIRNKYAQEFQTKDAAYWMDEVYNLNQGYQHAKTEQEKWMDRRLLSFINMMTYIRISDMLNNKQLDAAGPYLNVFKASDPKNPDGPYLTADWFALRGAKLEAISALSEALKLGYDDFAHFSSDNMLSSLQDVEAYHTCYKILSK